MKYIYIAVLSAPLFAQSIAEDENIVKDTIGISTASIEKSGLTQEQIVKLDEQTRILLAEYNAVFLSNVEFQNMIYPQFLAKKIKIGSFELFNRNGGVAFSTPRLPTKGRSEIDLASQS